MPEELVLVFQPNIIECNEWDKSTYSIIHTPFSIKAVCRPHILAARASGEKFATKGQLSAEKLLFVLGKSIIPVTISINQPTRRNIFTSLLLDVYVWLNIFGAHPRPSSGAYNYTSSLWFYRWRVAVAVLLVVVCQTTNNSTATTTLQR